MQSFSYHIFGQGIKLRNKKIKFFLNNFFKKLLLLDTCTIKFKESFIARTFKNIDEPYDTPFNLKAETLIYSNYEQSLSFLIHISFTSPNKISKLFKRKY